MSGTSDGQVIYVIATTPVGTASALREAHRLGAGAVRIVLLVPADGHGGADSASLIDEFSIIARGAHVHATPYVCVCREPCEVVRWFPVGDAPVVIGGSRGTGSEPTDEGRLAEALEQEGHRVRFSAIDGPDAATASHA